MTKQTIYSIDEIESFREPTDEENKKIYPWYEYHTEEGLKGFQLFGCIGLLVSIPCLVTSVTTRHFTVGNFFVMILGIFFAFIGISLFGYVSNHHKIKRAIKNKEYKIVEVELYKGEDDILNETALGYFKTLEGEEYSQPIRIVITDMSIGSKGYLIYCPIARKYQLQDFTERVLTDYMLSEDGLKHSIKTENLYIKDKSETEVKNEE